MAVENTDRAPFADGKPQLPPSRALFGRLVVNTAGARLGRIELVVRHPDDERFALLRRGLIRRRQVVVSLRGARLDGEHVLVVAEPTGHLPLPPATDPDWPRPTGSNGGSPHRAA